MPEYTIGEMFNPVNAINAIGNAWEGVTGSGANRVAQDAAENTQYWNQQNYNLQRENLDYQKALQQTMFNREDNAVQRRAADLQAAGMSPVLAAGQASNAGPEIRTDAPQMSTSHNQMKTDAANANRASSLQFAQLLNNVGMSAAQTKLLEEQAKELKIKNDINSRKDIGLEAQTQLRIDQARQDLTEQQWDFTKQKLLGMPKGTDPSSLEGWLYMMDDPNVPAEFKAAFGVKGTWEEIKDIWRTFIGTEKQVTHTYTRGNTKK